MLQALLKDRFQLAIHRGTEEQPLYALVMARKDGKLGPGLTESRAGSCIPFDQTPASRISRFHRQALRHDDAEPQRIGSHRYSHCEVRILSTVLYSVHFRQVLGFSTGADRRLIRDHAGASRLERLVRRRTASHRQSVARHHDARGHQRDGDRAFRSDGHRMVAHDWNVLLSPWGLMGALTMGIVLLVYDVSARNRVSSRS